jgi:hypothetical protein
MEVLSTKMEIKNKDRIEKYLLEYLFPFFVLYLLPGIYLRRNICVTSGEELSLADKICSDCKVL